jgi:dTDP-glucose 4,6-dehydratase
MRIIVTGGAGFIGSAVVCSAVKAGHQVLTIDKLTYAGRREALAEVIGSPHHHFLKADIADSAAMEIAFVDFDADAVLRLAAESHVDRSIDGPGEFVATNVNGTFVLLEAATRQWSRLSGERRDRFRFIHVSTDEVFGSLGETGCFDSSSRYAPNSPYAASKAASDHFARAWHHTYGLPVIVTNCSNNYGPRQHAEKLIPTVIRHALDGAPIPVYGSGANTRDWLYVEDHVSGLLAALGHGKPGDTYLFGGRCEVRNIDLVTKICALLDARSPHSEASSYAQQITFVTDRPGHDFRYAIDPSHAEAALGWAAKERLERGLAATIDWYLANSGWLIPVSELGRQGTRRADTTAASPPSKAGSS